MIISKCRNCSHKNFLSLINLGKISFTGRFPKLKETEKKGIIKLIKCKSCNLIQLSENFKLKDLYGQNYGYRTGINNTMTHHVKKIVKKLSFFTNIKKNDAVLDIASNDGTLLNFYNKNITTFGIDPILNKYKNNYKNIKFKTSNFFSYERVRKLYKKKFKIITALSVFYDLPQPNIFLSDIHKLLDDKGIFLIEFADLYSIIKNKMFDTFCHEHLEYYSTEVLIKMLIRNNLKLIDIKENKINGASKQFYVTQINSKYRVKKKVIEHYLKLEKNSKISEFSTFYKLKKQINKLKIKLRTRINYLKKKNKIIHGYGASTKGNVLLQYFNINNKMISYIADRNPNKINLYTPGSKIKIISEKDSRKMNPDYYVVLPWHFKDEIIKREKKLISKGTTFIFPLPTYNEFKK